MSPILLVGTIMAILLKQLRRLKNHLIIVLININTKNVVSGDSDYILEKIEKNMEKYISTLLSYLNDGTIFYSYWMRNIIEEGWQ